MTNKLGFNSALTAHLEKEAPAAQVQALAAQIRAFLESRKGDLDGVAAIGQTAAAPKISGLKFVTPVQIEASRFLNEIEAVWLMSNIISLLNDNLAQFPGVARFRDDAVPPIKRTT